MFTEIPGPTRHTNIVYEDDLEYAEKYNNRKNEIGDGYSFHPKNTVISNNEHTTKFTSNEGSNINHCLRYIVPVSIIIKCLLSNL